MIDPSLLRCTTALAHCVPGAGLRVRTGDGETISVSHHPGAQLTPCSFRRTVIASSYPGNPSLAQWLNEVEVGGSLSTLGAGLYLSDDHEEPAIWFASPLPPAVVVEVLSEPPVDEDEPETNVEVGLKADTALGVTVIGVRRDQSDPGHQDVDLVDVALGLHAQCLVAEITRAMPSERPA